MSVLIEGVEMPKYGCRDCIFVNFKWYGDVCPILKKEVTENIARCGFHPDCPLVEVPPHGRLIDADAVSLEGGPYEYDEWCKWALEQYQDAPAIIQADEADMDSFIRIFEEDDEEDGMDSFIRILKD